MPVSLNDPLIQGAVLPLLTALVATGAFRLLPVSQRIASLGSLAIGLGVVLVVVMVQGLIFPPVASTHKLPYLLLAALLLGGVCDLRRSGALVVGLLAIAWPLLVVFWLNSNRLARLDTGGWLTMAGFAAGAVLFLAGLNRLRTDSWAALMVTLFGALGVGVIALIGSSALLALFAFALAAACGGHALWNWPRQRDGYGVAALLGGAGAGVTLAAQSFLFTDASGWGLLGLLGLLANRWGADKLCRRLGLESDVGKTLAVAAVSFLVVLLAAGLAFALAEPVSDYGY